MNLIDENRGQVSGVITAEEQLQMVESAAQSSVAQIFFLLDPEVEQLGPGFPTREDLPPVGGKSVAVRIGRRASIRYSVVGEVVDLVVGVNVLDPQGAIKAGTARVASDDPFIFKNIPAKLLQQGADPRFWTYDPVLQLMRDMYGDQFSEEAAFTIYSFERLS